MKNVQMCKYENVRIKGKKDLRSFENFVSLMLTKI
jgi:hypothetical protein